mgnify:CR=1 FL=1
MHDVLLVFLDGIRNAHQYGLHFVSFLGGDGHVVHFRQQIADIFLYGVKRCLHIPLRDDNTTQSLFSLLLSQVPPNTATGDKRKNKDDNEC